MLAHERGTNRTRSAVSAGSKSIESLEKAPGGAPARARYSGSLRAGNAARLQACVMERPFGGCRPKPAKNAAGPTKTPGIWLGLGYGSRENGRARIVHRRASIARMRTKRSPTAGRYVGRSRKEAQHLAAGVRTERVSARFRIVSAVPELVEAPPRYGTRAGAPQLLLLLPRGRSRSRLWPDHRRQAPPNPGAEAKPG